MDPTNNLVPPDHAEVDFHPPILLLAALAVGFALRWIWPLAFLPVAIVVLFGPGLVMAAFGIFFWAAAAMRWEKTSIPTGEPTMAIVTFGPYQWSRNPIYLAMLLLLVGVGIWVNSLWFVILAVIFGILLSRGVIAPEERYLERKFGSTYTEYKARVRRWL